MARSGLDNHTKLKIDIEKLIKEPLKMKFDRKGPKVLVYHTHTSESYVLKPENLGKDRSRHLQQGPTV
jgi:stage II sporulation protein P